MMDGIEFESWGWDGGMWLWMVLFWVVIIAVIVLIVRLLRSEAVAKRSEKTPLQILKERYARGDIGKDEFDQKKRDLES